MYDPIHPCLSSLGKTHLFIALGYRIIDIGHRVDSISMDNLVCLLKPKIQKEKKIKINKIYSPDFISIDKIECLMINHEEINMFSN